MKPKLMSFCLIIRKMPNKKNKKRLYVFIYLEISGWNLKEVGGAGEGGRGFGVLKREGRSINPGDAQFAIKNDRLSQEKCANRTDQYSNLLVYARNIGNSRAPESIIGNEPPLS